MKDCPFCHKDEVEIIAENDLSMAFYDHFPVNKGHTLVVPKRHVATLFKASPAELASMQELIWEAREILERLYTPDGYNIGVNVGAAAGQTVFHLHVHVIPRYLGDVEDPRGGVRRVKKSSIPYLAEGEK